jgi:hypothetical protein
MVPQTKGRTLSNTLTYFYEPQDLALSPTQSEENMQTFPTSTFYRFSNKIVHLEASGKLENHSFWLSKLFR